MGRSYSLDQLDDVQRELVQRWLAAMFNDGIADELISYVLHDAHSPSLVRTD